MIYGDWLWEGKDTHEPRFGAQERAGGRSRSGRAAKGSPGAGVLQSAQTWPGLMEPVGWFPRWLPSIRGIKPPSPVHTYVSPPTLPQVPAPLDAIVPRVALSPASRSLASSLCPCSWYPKPGMTFPRLQQSACSLSANVLTPGILSRGQVRLRIFFFFLEESCWDLRLRGYK